jgi:DNA-binding LacI/PurR family transcriptional regulator
VALIGFGDSDVAALLDPALTTVSLPAHEMGRRAMAMLRSLVAGRRARPRLV